MQFSENWRIVDQNQTHNYPFCEFKIGKVSSAIMTLLRTAVQSGNFPKTIWTRVVGNVLFIEIVISANFLSIIYH